MSFVILLGILLIIELPEKALFDGSLALGWGMAYLLMLDLCAQMQWSGFLYLVRGWRLSA